MILEGIVSTVDENGGLNIAPMGPRLEPGFDRFVLRPFRDSTTCRNLLRHKEGVLHVTDDVLLLARAAISKVSDVETRPAERISGRVLLDCCRYYEFRVVNVDDREERVSLVAETVCSGWIREFLGFNRAKHAVIEVAILATRLDFVLFEEVAIELFKYRRIVEKTGGAREREAFAFLEARIRDVATQRGFDMDQAR